MCGVQTSVQPTGAVRGETRRRNGGVNGETCEGCASSCCYIGKQPWLIPFSPGSPLCQPAGEIDLWVKRAFFYLFFLVQGGGGGGGVLGEVGDGYLLNWWRGDLMIHWQVQRLTHTHTRSSKHNTNVLSFAIWGNFFSCCCCCCCCCWGNLGRRRHPPFPRPCSFSSPLTHKEAFRSYKVTLCFVGASVSHFCAMSLYRILFCDSSHSPAVWICRAAPSCRGMRVIAVSFLTLGLKASNKLSPSNFFFQQNIQ